MRSYRNTWPVLAVLLVPGVSGALRAEDFMSADAIRRLLTGNTMHCTNFIRDESFINYFRADGTVTKLASGGGKSRGTWHVTEDGMHCLDWGEHERCNPIADLGDGTYQKIEDGHPRSEFTVIDGNPNGL